MLRFLLIFVLLGGFCRARPNVLMILADDQGWGDLSSNGNRTLQTPNIDSLGRDGAVFDRFYVCPVCSPTRAEIMTGRYHLRTGVRDASRGGERLDTGEETMAEVFRQAGYGTGLFGKWHLGTQWPYHPNARGFEEFYGYTSGHWGTYWDAPLDENGKDVESRGYLADAVTDRAIEWIGRQSGKPFFCWLCLPTPHSPMQVPEKYWSRFAAAELAQRGGRQEDAGFTRAALAMGANIDDNVGRILRKLDEQKLAADTIVIYMSDNGPNSPRWNGEMKGTKGSVDEGGVRSPFLIRWPGKIAPGKKVTQIAAAIDLLPTLTECMGISARPRKPLDGISLVPLLTKDNPAWPERTIFSHWAGKMSLRTRQHRFHATGALWDMLADAGQERDIAAAQPETAAALRRALDDWRMEMAGGLTADARPFTVGHAAVEATLLPARDGVPHGGIKRSAGAPNDSHFVNWTAPADSITWEAEVLTAGNYEILLHYTCAAENTGAVVQFSAGAVTASAAIAEAFDPPLRGAAEDRVPRKGESYVKPFRVLNLGKVTLPAGRASFQLRALSVPGQMVADVGGISVRRAAQ